jgi:hypothetical protein
VGRHVEQLRLTLEGQGLWDLRELLVE